MDDLLGNWRSLFDSSADLRDVEASGRDLLRRWAEPHRHYHGVEHLRSVLRHLERLGTHALDADACMLAAWFHDAVYDGRPGEDERASAELGRDVLSGLDVAADRVAEVVRLVELTATHAPAADDVNGAVLCDADLAILGSPPREYAAYVAAVRAEYAHVPDAEFRNGRTAVLRHLLARDPLYSTTTARDLWEVAARRNMTTELPPTDFTA